MPPSVCTAIRSAAGARCCFDRRASGVRHDTSKFLTHSPQVEASGDFKHPIQTLSLSLRYRKGKKGLFYFDRTGRLRRDIKATGSSTITRGGELGLQPRLSDTPLFSRYLWLRSCFCDISARDARGGHVRLVRLTDSSKHKRCKLVTATLTAFFHLQISNMNLINATDSFHSVPDTSIYDPAKSFYVLLMTTTKLLLYWAN